MGIFGIIFAIAVAIIVSVIKEAKKAKNAEKARQERQEREARQSTASTTTTKPSQPSLLQPHTHSEQQRVTPISSTLNVESKDEARERAQRELQARLNEYKARKADVEAQRNRTTEGRIAPTIAPRVSATTTAHSHNEAHSDIVFKDHAKYRVEEVPVMNSIGGQSDEGCSEHYNLRYVKIDRPIIPEHLELTELQKCIVYGEIINQPAFRKNYRR